jgi:hypothetical protein
VEAVPAGPVIGDPSPGSASCLGGTSVPCLAGAPAGRLGRGRGSSEIARHREVRAQVALDRRAQHDLLDDGAGRQRDAEQDRGGHVLGLHHRGARARVGHQRPVVEDRRVDLGREDRRRPDALVAEHRVDVAHEVPDGGLGRAVRRAAEQSGPEGGGRRHGHDGAAAARDHVGQDRLGQRVHAGHVDREDALPLLAADPADVADAARRARVVDQHVHAPVVLDGPAGEADGLVRMADVDRAGRGAAARPDDLGGQRVEGRRPPRGQHHRRALRGEEERRGAADAAAGARDDGDLPLQFLHG